MSKTTVYYDMFKKNSSAIQSSTVKCHDDDIYGKIRWAVNTQERYKQENPTFFYMHSLLTDILDKFREVLIMQGIGDWDTIDSYGGYMRNLWDDRYNSYNITISITYFCIHDNELRSYVEKYMLHYGDKKTFDDKLYIKPLYNSDNDIYIERLHKYKEDREKEMKSGEKLIVINLNLY